jgi:hypothetical protein
MSNIDVSNLGFKVIQDTFYDAKMMEGLSKLGVLPNTFQLRVCTVDLEGLAVGTAVIQALIDDHTGEQIVFSPGQQIILLRAGAEIDIADPAELTLFQIGLSSTATGAITANMTLSNAGTGALLNGAGVSLTLGTAANGGVIQGSNIYGVISTTVDTTALTAGVARIVIATV